MTQHQKKLAQVCQLLALARSTTFPKERESAQEMAKKFMASHGISELEIKAFRMSLEPKRLPPRPQPQRRRTVVVVNLGFDPFVTTSFGSSYTDVNSSNIHFHIQF